MLYLLKFYEIFLYFFFLYKFFVWFLVEVLVDSELIDVICDFVLKIYFGLI